MSQNKIKRLKEKFYMSSAGIEPTPSAYQAPVLPLNYKPRIHF